jgi:hypothetical protein
VPKIHLLLLPIALAALGPCSKNPPPPPRACATAEECFGIGTDVSQTCNFGDDRYPSEFFHAYDFHTKRDIIAVVKVVVQHLNTNLPPDEYRQPAYTEAKPKGTIRGGRPNYVDYSGPVGDLGCRFVKPRAPGATVDEYYFTPEAVCFKDDTSCKLPTAPTGSELQTCEDECNRAGGSCTKADVGPSGKLTKFSADLIGGVFPQRIDWSGILNSFGMTPSCVTQPELNIDTNQNVSAVGQPCSVQIPLPNNSPYYAAFFDTPSVLAGKLSRSPAPIKQAEIKWDVGATMLARTYADVGAPTVTEPVVALRIRPEELLFASTGKFCARVNFKRGD